MNTANQMAEEIYGLHCDIGRLEKEKKHWHTEFINEHEYAHMMEEQAEKAEVENAKLRKVMGDLEESDRIHRTMLRQVTELKAKVKAENAKLRQQLADVTESMGRVEERCARLRKLAEDMLPFISEETGFCTADCYMCSECCETKSDSECPAVARIHERAHELRIEVTDG